MARVVANRMMEHPAGWCVTGAMVCGFIALYSLGDVGVCRHHTVFSALLVADRGR